MEPKRIFVTMPVTWSYVPRQTHASIVNLLCSQAMFELAQKHHAVCAFDSNAAYPMDCNRNTFVTNALNGNADYLMFLDMDMTFPKDAILRLFEQISDENPIVSGMYHRRQDPYWPVMGDFVDWDEQTSKVRDELEALGHVDTEKNKQLMMWAHVAEYGENTFNADVIGLGCVLMKADVFKKIGYPWFKYSPMPWEERPYNKVACEAIYFCAQLKKAGIPILVDPKIQCGHVMQAGVTKEIFQNRLADLKQKKPKITLLDKRAAIVRA